MCDKFVVMSWFIAFEEGRASENAEIYEGWFPLVAILEWCDRYAV